MSLVRSMDRGHDRSMKFSSLFASGLFALAAACGGQVSDRIGSPPEGTPKDIPNDVLPVPPTCVPDKDAPITTLDSCAPAMNGFLVDLINVEWEKGATPWAQNASGWLHLRFRNRAPVHFNYPGAQVRAMDSRVATPAPNNSLMLYSMGACSEYTELRAAFKPLVTLASGTKVRFEVQRMVAMNEGIGDCGGKLAPTTLEIVVP